MFLVIDPDLKRAFADLFSEQPADIPEWQHGSTRPLEVCIAKRIANPQTPRVREPVDISQWSMRAAVGKGFLVPVAGTFTITFGANTTADITYNPTSTELEDALNLLASIIAAGSVTVEGENGFFTIAFGNNGARALLDGDETDLAPASVLDFGTLIEGTVDRPTVQVLRIVQNPGALATLGVLSDPAAAAVIPVQTGGAGLNAKARVSLMMRSSGALITGGIYRIELFVAGDDFVNVGGTNATGDVFTATGTAPTTWANKSVLSRVGAQPPYDGQFTLSVRGLETAMLDYDCLEADVQAALENLQTTSGLLVVGAKYKIVSYLGADDFVNVGAASNATGVVFVASGTTPTLWTSLSALTPVGEGNVSVSKETPGQYLFAFQGDMANTAMGVISADGSGLRVMKTLQGSLDLRTANIDLLLDGETSDSVTFEVEGTPPEESLQKLFREVGTLLDSIMDPSNTTNPQVGAPYLELYNPDTAKFHRITISGVEGAVVFDISPGL